MDIYHQHSWSAGTWALMLLVVVVFVLALSAMFLWGLDRACRWTSTPGAARDVGPAQPEPAPARDVPSRKDRSSHTLSA